MRRPAFAWAGLALAVVLLLTGAVLNLASKGDRYEVLAGFVIVIPFVVVGALIAARQPQNPIGWLLGAVGLSLALSGASDGAIQYGLTHSGWDPLLGYFALVSSLGFNAFFALLILVLVLLPNGRLPSPRWRVVPAGLAVLIAARHENLGVRALRPTHRRQRAGHRPGRAVRIAVTEAAAERVGHLAAGVEQIERIGNLQAVLEYLFDFAARIAFAAHLTAKIDEHAIDELNLRMLGEKRFKLGVRGSDPVCFVSLGGSQNAHGTPLAADMKGPAYCSPA